MPVRWREARGSQMVEFALVAPLLLFMVFAVPVLGMIVRAWVVVEASAREGARYYAQSWYLQDPALVDKVRSRVTREVVDYGGLKTQDSDGTVLFSPRDIVVTQDRDCARVTVHYAIPSMLPMLGALLDGGSTDGGKYIHLTGSACFLPERG